MKPKKEKKERRMNKIWYKKNKEKVIRKSKEWAKENKDKRKSIIKKYNNKPLTKLYMKQYRDDNRDIMNKNKMKKYYNNITYRLNFLFGNHLRKVLSKNTPNKKFWSHLVGYTISDLKKHLENQFKEGMNWENHRIDGWHIDHKISKIKFKFKSYKDPQFRECWSLNNLQPLWQKENLTKATA